jgi:urea transport system substrate-binding protein
VGHLAAWNYFQSIKSPANTEFIKVVGLRQGQEAAWR